MKDIFKGAATRAGCGVGPFRDFYVALRDKGMKPEVARLTNFGDVFHAKGRSARRAAL